MTNLLFFVIFTAFYLIASAITTFDIRLIQAKRVGNLTPDQPMLPKWIGIIHWIEWGLAIILLVLSWKLAIFVFVVKFILQVTPVLEILGNIFVASLKPSLNIKKKLSKKILLIEDTLEILQLVKDALEKEGYSVDTVSSGKKALTKIRTTTYDLILLDIIIPEIDGLSILKKIKNQKIKNGPVIVYDNLESDKIIGEALDLGAVGYLLKGKITPSHLVKEINLYFDSPTEWKGIKPKL
jgi:CheY-like chemotaxis protein